MKKHLVVDGQIFQSPARHRGMGRYSEYLVNAITQQKKSYESITLILSDRHEEYEDLLFENVHIKRLDLYDSSHLSLEDAEIHNKKIIDSYINTLDVERSEIDYLLLAPFQEPLVSEFPNGVNKFLVVYDLIPYLYHEQYIYKMPFEKYLRHYKLLFEADKLLAISESVKSDVCLYLGIPESRVVAIHGAAVRSQAPRREPDSITVPEKFILMPTGDDPRKNNAKGVRGFELFNKKHNNEYKLIITSNIHFSEKITLEKLSNNIIFTGNISESELDWLYSACSAVLFVSESEGLGLPILEAVEWRKQIVASSLDVFREISMSAFHYCDQTDEESICKGLLNAVKNRLSSQQKKEYSRIQNYYSWTETGKRATSVMQTCTPRQPIDKKKIAVFTPRPDGISAIGKVVAETHPLLAEHFDVDYFYEEGPAFIHARPNYLQYVANYYPATHFSVSAYKEYDAVFYHVGNSEYHLQSIANGLYLPGYVIVHDTNISDAYRVMAEHDVVSRDRVELEAEITRVAEHKLSNHLASLVTNQIAIMTHSDYAKRAIREIHKDILVECVNLPTNVATSIPQRDYKTLSFGLAGIIADIKGTEVIERLIKDKDNKKHNFSLFGYNYSSDTTLKRIAAYKNVTVATNVSDYDFVKKMRQLDVFVNYRMKYQGETSLSTLEAMRQGVVVVVRNIGWYAELPDDVVVKVESIEDLEEKVRELIENPAKLKQIADRAVEYIKNFHSHESYVLGMKKLMSYAIDSRGSKGLEISNKIKLEKISTKEDLKKEQRL